MGHGLGLLRIVDSLEKTLMLGGIGGRRRRGRQRMRWLDGITNLMGMGLGRLRGVGDGQGDLACCDSWGGKESDMTEWLNWTELNCDIEWVALETNIDHSVVFEIASKYCLLDSFVDYEGYSISSKGFLPTVLYIMVIWVKFTHDSPF